MSEGVLELLLDARKARRQGPAAIKQRQRTRLTEMVSFARANSPYYRELYLDLPEQVEDPTLLPVTSKKQLMARFNDWATDRAVTIEAARAFVDNPDLIGEQFLGRYTALTTSGTTGTRGIFLLDERSFAVTNAMAFRMLSSWLNAGDIIRILAKAGRMTMVMATGGHFASAVAAVRLKRRRGKALQTLSVHMPLPDLVAQLNHFQPAILAPYASLAALLANEQKAGRLHINPVLIVASAEGLAAGEYDRIATSFHAKVRDSYAATECPFLSYRCEHGWLHVNSDWVVLEPVDADYRPVQPGEQSYTVLISNLANRIQPILRYDLGDSVLLRPDPCPCGNSLPAIRVQGRAADVLTFPTDDGKKVTLAPLAFGTLVDHIPGIELIQIVQTTPECLHVRFRPAEGADPDRVWQMIHREITELLNKHALNIKLERAEEPPQQSPGGKYRSIIPLRSA